MHIGLTKLLKVSPPNAKYDMEEKLHKKYTKVNQVDDGKIKKAMAANNDKNNDEEDPQEKNK